MSKIETESEAQFGKDTTEKPVFAEMSEDGKYIEIYFRPAPKWLDSMHDLGAKFMSNEKVDQPHWRLNLDFWKARDLTNEIGKDNLELGEALNEWAWEHKDTESRITEILTGVDLKLERLPEVLPDLADAIYIGPKGRWMTPAERKEALKGDASFQISDVAYMAFVDSPLNANQPGLGKTVETIAAIFEAGIEEGPHLVVAPLTSLETVWQYELSEWQPFPVLRAAGDGLNRSQRYGAVREAEIAHLMGRPFWLLVNPEMVRLRKRDKAMESVKANLYAEHPFIQETEWNSITIDEAHKNALRNMQTVTAKGIHQLKVAKDGKKIALSGTPLGGKPINLFGILHYLHPDHFPSKYKWAQQWLEVDGGEYGTLIGDVREDRQDEFDRHLAPYVVRRTKAEVVKDLPAIQYVELWCSMTESQEEQYTKFAKMAEVELGDVTLTATNVLSIYTRLKQFAMAKQRFEDGKLIPTEDSGKMHVLMEKLDELGIIEGDGDQQAVIFSQFETVVNLVYDMLKAKGVAVERMVGRTKKRADVTRSFQDGEAKVLVMTTDTGGVSITLDKADSVFILDEKWNPDDQTQAEDRCHRASRIHQVTAYYLRSSNTIEEYIRKVTGHKGRINKRILDERRIRLYKQAA